VNDTIKAITDSILSEGVGDAFGIIKVYDNSGRTADRYTVLFRDGSFLNLSENPGHPQGVSVWGVGGKPGTHWGEEIAFDDLPFDVQKHVQLRVKEM
jgi:hypothetical protein